MGKLCRYFDECSAPLCPRDPSSLEHGIWYADEEICRLKRYQRLPWVRAQKRIAKINESNPVFGYFTVEMLNALKRVKHGIKGLDPDKDRASELRKWRRSIRAMESE